MTGASEVRVEIDHQQGVTEVRLRRPRRWLNIVTIVPVTALWLLGAGFAALMLGVSDQTWFMVTWLTLWVLGGGVMLLALVLGAFTTETLLARSDGVTLLRRLLLLKLPTELPAGDVAELRWIADSPTRVVRVNGRRIPQTALEVPGNPHPVQFARGIGKPEAESVIAAIRQRLVVPRGRRR